MSEPQPGYSLIVMPAIEVQDANADDRAWVDKQYGPIDFRLTRDRDTHVVALIAGERVGAGRIVVIEPGIGELGGIYTLPEHRGKGVARSIVVALLQRATQEELYCLPYSHLERFYAGFGFERISLDDIECEYVRDKLEWCTGRYAYEVIVQVKTVR